MASKIDSTVMYCCHTPLDGSKLTEILDSSHLASLCQNNENMGANDNKFLKKTHSGCIVFPKTEMRLSWDTGIKLSHH